MLGKGSILLDLFDPTSGLPTGFQHLGNCTKFEIDIKDDLAELYQSITHTPSLIATAVKKRQPKVTIEGTDFNSKHIAIAQMAPGKTALATTATTFTSEVLITAVQAPNAAGRFFRAANLNTDPTAVPPVLTSNAVTLVAGTDYELMDPIKSIYYIPIGTSIASHAVTLTYNTLAGSFDQVAAGTVAFQTGHLLFAPDPVDGQKIGCDIWHCNLNPNGQIGLIADDYGKWQLDGNILDDTANHPASPYFLYTFF
jgi:hypothetical protein